MHLSNIAVAVLHLRLLSSKSDLCMRKSKDDMYIIEELLTEVFFVLYSYGFDDFCIVASRGTSRLVTPHVTI